MKCIINFHPGSRKENPSQKKKKKKKKSKETVETRVVF